MVKNELISGAAIVFYFMIQGIIEGIIWRGDKRLIRRYYHLFRIFESLAVFMIAVTMFYFPISLAKIIGVSFTGLWAYELMQNLVAFDNSIPTQSFIYTIFGKEFIVTPLTKLMLMVLYVLIGVIILSKF